MMVSSLSQLLFLSLLSLLSLPFLSARVHHASHSTPAFTSPLPRVTSTSPSVHKTVLQWERQLQTCDPHGADLDIDLTGTSRVIYAIGGRDPTSDTTVPFHSTMGVKNVNLLDSPTTPQLPDVTEQHRVMSRPFPIDKNTLTAPSTYYHCQAFQRNFTQRSHIIKVTPQVDFYHSSLVHHMLLFRCDGAMSAADLAWAGNCYGSSTPRTVSACDQVHVLAGWAVGGGEFYYPPDVGFPIGPGPVYMMLQIHYHNPRGVTFNDSAGFILTSTPMLRKFDAGTIVVHHELSTLSIPARSPAHNISVYTPPECLKGVPSSGLKVFGSMLHTHESGIRVRTQHYRGGQELAPLDSNMHYDFNFQQVVSFDPEAYPVLMAGDSLKLTCTYNTLDRPNATRGGISTKDEMCDHPSHTDRHSNQHSPALHPRADCLAPVCAVCVWLLCEQVHGLSVVLPRGLLDAGTDHRHRGPTARQPCRQLHHRLPDGQRPTGVHQHRPPYHHPALHPAQVPAIPLRAPVGGGEWAHQWLHRHHPHQPGAVATGPRHLRAEHYPRQ